MKKLTVLILTTCLFNSTMLLSAHAQNGGADIAQLRASIVALEKIERNVTTTGEVAALNREFLIRKRQQLRAALLQRQTSLEEYLLVAGSSLDQTESQALQLSITSLRRELQRLDASLGDADGARTEGRGVAVPVAPSADSGTPALAEAVTRSSATGGEAASVLPARWESAADATARPEPPVQNDVSNSCPSCLPSPALDEEKDFIINARTGETSGKTRFGRNDRARIIVTDKNPFLYEYRVTLKAIPIAETAIAAFFGRFPLFADDLKSEQREDPNARRTAPTSCPDELNRAMQVERELAAEDSSTNANSLRKLYLAEKSNYDAVAGKFKQAQDVLYSPNASCPTLCSTATNIRSTLQNYKPKLEDLSARLAEFKANVTLLRTRVNRLLQGPTLPADCADELDRLRRLSIAYAETADSFEKGMTTITNGKKTFDAAVKSINDVFANPNAFYQVYTRGPFGSPTDLEVTVERRNLREESATFVKVGETQTLNFGGGPRFALAGGVVVSPLETITFKRVPAIIGGRSTTIIGAENSSNSRILPILMLHGRLFETPRFGFVSGVHLSLGITAKPNDEGTNVEYLVGPSLSFIEERLFLTVGGYAGRRQQLEGNLVPGQELPESFKDDIPINNRLAWKPGFALTYKFK